MSAPPLLGRLVRLPLWLRRVSCTPGNARFCSSPLVSPLCSSFCCELRSAVLSLPAVVSAFCCSSCCCCLLFGKSTLLCSPICLQAVVLQALPGSSCFAPLPTLLSCRLWGSPNKQHKVPNRLLQAHAVASGVKRLFLRPSLLQSIKILQ